MKNENNNNYVMPEKVDLTKVNVDHNDDNLLNRERDNIVSASIQANSSINEKDAKIVNNSIKVKKKNPLINFLIVVILLAFAIFITYTAVSLTKKYVDEKTITTTTTTTTVKINTFLTYLRDESKVRKFQDDTHILILLPILKLKYSYILLNIDENGIIDKTIGTYDLTPEKIKLTSNDETVMYVDITEEDLKLNEYSLTSNDSEMKYYTYEDDNTLKLLFINGSPRYTLAYYEEINNGSITSTIYDYTETKESITLSNGEVFTKDGTNLVNGEYTYSIGK